MGWWSLFVLAGQLRGRRVRHSAPPAAPPILLGHLEPCPHAALCASHPTILSAGNTMVASESAIGNGRHWMLCCAGLLATTTTQSLLGELVAPWWRGRECGLWLHCRYLHYTPPHRRRRRRQGGQDAGGIAATGGANIPRDNQASARSPGLESLTHTQNDVRNQQERVGQRLDTEQGPAPHPAAPPPALPPKHCCSWGQTHGTPACAQVPGLDSRPHTHHTCENQQGRVGQEMEPGWAPAPTPRRTARRRRAMAPTPMD